MDEGWHYPEPVDLRQGFEWWWATHANPTTPPYRFVAGAATGASEPGDPETYATVPPPSWAVAAFLHRVHATFGEGVTSGVSPGRIRVHDTQPYPVADTGVAPPGATHAEHDGIGTYSGPYEVSIEWGVVGSAQGAGGATVAHLGLLPGSTPETTQPALTALGQASTPAQVASALNGVTLLGSATATTMAPPSPEPQNVFGATQADIDARTNWVNVSLLSTSGWVPLTVVTAANLAGAAPAPPVVSDGLMGWWAGAARIRSVVITRSYTPPRWRWVYGDEPPQRTGMWRMRQRQSAAGADGWALRQRQAGVHAGSWPLRQRQPGA